MPDFAFACPLTVILGFTECARDDIDSSGTLEESDLRVHIGSRSAREDTRWHHVTTRCSFGKDEQGKRWHCDVSCWRKSCGRIPLMTGSPLGRERCHVHVSDNTNSMALEPQACWMRKKS